MIEILVALVITLIGLFGLLGFNLRTFQAESESYQRTQALVLVDDMAQRIRANRAGIASYVAPAASGVGTGAVDTNCPAAAGAARDVCQWGNLLRGAAESVGGSNVGAMADARGCIFVTTPAAGAAGPSTASVVVVWRGVNATATVATAPCVPTGYSLTDGLMRYTATIVRLGDLDGT